MSIIPHEEV
jgi:hypothetical protein